MTTATVLNPVSLSDTDRADYLRPRGMRTWSSLVHAREFFLKHGYLTRYSTPSLINSNDVQAVLRGNGKSRKISDQFVIHCITVRRSAIQNAGAAAFKGATHVKVYATTALSKDVAARCLVNDIQHLSPSEREPFCPGPLPLAASLPELDTSTPVAPGIPPLNEASFMPSTAPAASEDLPAEVLNDLHRIQAAVDQSTQQAAQQIHARGRDDQLAVLIRGALASTTGHGTVCLNAALNLLSAS